MSSLFSTTSNYSFYAIPAAWVIAMIPHVFATSKSKSFDRRAPRTYAQCLEKDQTLDRATKDMILRAESAQANGFENLPLFATAVIAGNLAGLPASTLNALSATYLASRAAYNVIYINSTTGTIASVRSLVFTVGLGICWTLFIKAGNVLKDKPVNLL